MKEKIPISPTGWWIAALLERFESSEGVRYWNNYRLIKAGHWRDAYHKALALGRVGEDSAAFGDRTQFLGITDLVPIYDDIEDGAEVLWEDYHADEDDSEGPPVETFSEAELEAIYEPDEPAEKLPPMAKSGPRAPTSIPTPGPTRSDRKGLCRAKVWRRRRRRR